MLRWTGDEMRQRREIGICEELEWTRFVKHPSAWPEYNDVGSPYLALLP
jgi:hypothetical protein